MYHTFLCNLILKSYNVRELFVFMYSCFFNSFVTLRFDQLNKCLASMSSTSERSPQHKRTLEYIKFKSSNTKYIQQHKKTNDDTNLIRAARAYYHDLISTSYMINKTFGIQMLMSITVYFGLVIRLFYNTCSVLLWANSTQYSIIEELGNSGSWLFFYILRIVLINSSCANATSAVRSVNDLIYNNLFKKFQFKLYFIIHLEIDSAVCNVASD